MSKWISKNLLLAVLNDISALGGSVGMGTIVIGIAFFDLALGLRLLTGMAVVMMVGYLIKALFRTLRPDDAQRPAATEAFDRLDASSFPSIHASRMGMFSTVLFLVGDLRFQLFLIAMTILVCTTRIVLQRHYIRDVIGGLILGVAAGVLIAGY